MEGAAVLIKLVSGSCVKGTDLDNAIPVKNLLRRLNYTCHPCDLFYNASTYLVNHILLILMEFDDVTIANITCKE